MQPHMGISSQDVISKNDDTKKPQLYFKDNIDNYSELFVPKIHKKPNSVKPLSSIITAFHENYDEFAKIHLTPNKQNFHGILKEIEHPYKFEIENLVWEDSGFCSSEE